MKNIPCLVRRSLFLIILFFLFNGFTPVQAQWVRSISNTCRTLTDSSLYMQVFTGSNDFDGASASNSGNITTIQVSRNPVQVVITKDSKLAFVRCLISNTIELIDIKKEKILKSFSVPAPVHATLSNDGKKLFVASLTDSLIDSDKYPDDCSSVYFYSSSKSFLTIIDIGTQQIENRFDIDVSMIRKILISSDNNIIYLSSDYEILEYNIEDSKITKRWEFEEWLMTTEIDRKNNKIFITNFSDSLKVLILPNGPIKAFQLYPDGTDATSTQIGIDTLSNRVFIKGKFVGMGSEVLVFDAKTLVRYPPIPCDFSFESIVTIPEKNRLFIGGFGGTTLELDYTTLNLKKTLYASNSWYSMVYNKHNNTIYSFQYGSNAGSSWNRSVPVRLDIIEYSINSGQITGYNTTLSEYGCVNGRTIAITPNDSLVLITNSPENTISILHIEQPNAVDEVLKDEGYSLSQNVPNPFNSATTIKYSIPHASKVKLQIIDRFGREVTVLVDEAKSAGDYFVNFNSTIFNLASGIYFYRLQAGTHMQTKKLILQR